MSLLNSRRFIVGAAIAFGCAGATSIILNMAPHAQVQSTQASPPTTFNGVTCDNCTMGTPTFTGPVTLDGIPLKACQSVRMNTAADGTFSWTYPVAWGSGIVPAVNVTAQATAPDIVNAQASAVPTNAAVSGRITRTSVVSILGINVLGLASNTATPINITACTP